MRLLLALDLPSPETSALIAQAARWAAQVGGTLDLAYVEGLRYAADFVSDPVVRQMLRKECERARELDQERLDALLAELPEAVRGIARLLDGLPVPALVEASQDYDLLLVGTHGRKGLARFWLGSVTEALMRQVEKPVLVLRAH